MYNMIRVDPKRMRLTGWISIASVNIIFWSIIIQIIELAGRICS